MFIVLSLAWLLHHGMLQHPLVFTALVAQTFPSGALAVFVGSDPSSLPSKSQQIALLSRHEPDIVVVSCANVS
jgi:hypothetical protein